MMIRDTAHFFSIHNQYGNKHFFADCTGRRALCGVQGPGLPPAGARRWVVRPSVALEPHLQYLCTQLWRFSDTGQMRARTHTLTLAYTHAPKHTEHSVEETFPVLGRLRNCRHPCICMYLVCTVVGRLVRPVKVATHTTTTTVPRWRFGFARTTVCTAVPYYNSGNNRGRIRHRAPMTLALMNGSGLG